MAYDEGLAQIFTDDLMGQEGLTTKKMFGGLCFLNNRHMVCGVHKSAAGEDMAMFRVGADQYQAALNIEGVSELSFTGRPMKGMVEASSDIFERDDARRRLLTMALKFTNSLPPKD